MKILLINNFHYYRGGVERCYLDTGKILEQQGHEVAYFSTSHPRNISSKWRDYFVSYYELTDKHSLLDKFKIILRFFYNFEAKRKIRKLIHDFNPDIVHAHNIYHHLSPSILGELKRHNIPVVMTLHDYKLICPNYSLFFRGENWEKSKPGKYYKCFLDRCVDNSYLKSLICTLEAYFHSIFKFYDQVDVFVSPSRFLADKFTEFGFKREIKIVPNPLILDLDAPRAEEEDYFIYFGRLTEEKGLEDVIKAWPLLRRPPKLLILGEGPLRKKLGELVEKKKMQDRIFFLGYQKKERLFELMAPARAVIFPSRWQENYPYAILEAGYLKKILICANVGGISEVVKNKSLGFIYSPGDRKKIKEAIEEVREVDQEKQDLIKKNIFNQVNKNNHPDKYYQRILNIYQLLINKKQSHV